MTDLSQGILQTLGIVAYVRETPTQFSAPWALPEWFIGICDHHLAEFTNDYCHISLDELELAFPFIANFLMDAEAIWNQPSDKFELSGIWTETDIEYKELQLEARASTIEGQAVLLIENRTPLFFRQQSVVQKAREIALLNEKLVTELNQRQRELQSEIQRHLVREASLQSIAQNLQGNTSAVMICQPDGRVEVINKALVDIYQADTGQSEPRKSLLDQWMSEAEAQYPEIKRVVEAGRYWEGEFETHDAGGRSRWIRLAIGPVKERNGHVSHYVCVANDISEYRSPGEAKDDAVNYDFTTHLPNRRHFWQHMNDLLARDPNHADTVSILYVDLDYFKRINDDLGHHAGDFLLSAMASRISRNVKHRDFVAHLGGDEFAVVIEGDCDEAQLASMAERLLSAIHEPIVVDGHSLTMTASIGGAIEPVMQSHASLVRKADLAMYAAKELGKGQFRFFDDSMTSGVPHKLQRERELIDAIERQEFVLFLQPQICLCDVPQVRAEALIRWQHPERGLLSPGEFIDIAEESGLIIPIGNWVLQSACAIGADLLARGQKVCIAVNISAKQLRHPQFYESVYSSLHISGFPAHLLELEITESSFLQDLETGLAMIRQVRELGVAISLDDFGTGFSSLNYLRRLPVDYLKIDQSFVRELPFNHESQAITRSIIKLAHELNISVIAEGVENEEQLMFLKNCRVNFVQGYYFYRPLSVSEVQRIFPQIEALSQR